MSGLRRLVASRQLARLPLATAYATGMPLVRQSSTLSRVSINQRASSFMGAAMPHTGIWAQRVRMYSSDASEETPAETEGATEDAAEAETEDAAVEKVAEAPSAPKEKKTYVHWRDWPLSTTEECEDFLKSMGSINFRKMSVSERQQFFDKRDLAKMKIKKVRDKEEFMELSTWAFSEVQNHYHSKSAHPVINPTLKENLYLTWAKDPNEWTLDKLAQKFRIKKLRVEAILMLKIDEKRLLKEDPEAVFPEGDDVDLGYSKKYGMVGQDGWCCSEHDDRVYLNERLPTGASYGAIDEEVDQEAALSHTLQAWIYPESLPLEPPNPENRMDGKVVRGPDSRTFKGRKRKSNNRRPVLLVDSSLEPDREINNTMLVRNPDKSTRHATWEERCEFWRRTMTGERAKKRLVENRRAMDPIVFPMDAEEERMMKEQDRPYMKNHKWAPPLYVTEKDTYRMTLRARHLNDRHIRSL